jgi:hypothetical protein
MEGKVAIDIESNRLLFDAWRLQSNLCSLRRFLAARCSETVRLMLCPGKYGTVRDSGRCRSFRSATQGWMGQHDRRMADRSVRLSSVQPTVRCNWVRAISTDDGKSWEVSSRVGRLVWWTVREVLQAQVKVQRTRATTAPSSFDVHPLLWYLYSKYDPALYLTLPYLESPLTLSPPSVSHDNNDGWHRLHEALRLLRQGCSEQLGMWRL